MLKYRRVIPYRSAYYSAGPPGNGLGRQLLRAALAFTQEKKYKKATLCVNGDNERAKELYLKEGFLQAEGVTAYEYFVS